MTTRRSFITGLVSFVAAPAIVRVSSIMPVKAERTLLTAQQIINLALHRINPPYGIGPAIQSLGFDLGAYGTGAIFVSHDGRVASAVHQSRVTLYEAAEQGWFG